MKYVHDSSKKIKLEKKRKAVLAVGIVLGLLLVTSGIYQMVYRQFIFKNSASAPISSVLTETDETPDENEPDTAQPYIVPPNQPQRIVISSVGIDGLIQKVGTDKNGRVVAPSNIHFAGWYVDAKIPGEEGLSILDGHVSGKYADGIFKKLVAVKVNDTITITYGDGSSKKFIVIGSVTVPEAQASARLFDKKNDIASQLNLITCGGKYNKVTKTYEDRIIVIAKLVTNNF